MLDAWGAQLTERLPDGVEVGVDVIATPDLSYPAVMTVSFDRVVPDSFVGNGGMQAELDYRVGSFSRRVLCDWRGQVSLTAQRLTVRARSYAPKLAAYDRGSATDVFSHSVLVSVGAGTRSSAYYSAPPVAVPTSPAGDETQPIAIPAMATRLLLRAVKTDGATNSQVNEELATGTIMLCKLGGSYPFHVESLATALAEGILLGDADQIYITVPIAPITPSTVILQPVFELAL